jgi:hypothetical protein
MPLPDEKSGRIWPQENLKYPTRWCLLRWDGQQAAKHKRGNVSVRASGQYVAPFTSLPSWPWSWIVPRSPFLQNT